MSQKKSKSPYQRHNKAPYLYSAELRAWHDAAKRNDARAMREQDEAWRKRFGVRKPSREAMVPTSLHRALWPGYEEAA